MTKVSTNTCELIWNHFYDYVESISQYNFKKQNETAVREELVEMANLLDAVRFKLFVKDTMQNFIHLKVVSV